MTAVSTYIVPEDEGGLRLDRWFRRHYPDLRHGALEKLLRTGQVRLDGSRAKSNARLEPGQKIRIPPLNDRSSERPVFEKRVTQADAEFVRNLVLHEDKHVIVLNKPAGLAVQGGSKTARHLDGMLEVLRGKDGEKPRLVHRLDRDTSGVLVLARTAAAAAKLTRAFRQKDVRKVYWGLCDKVPRPVRGKIDLPLAKEAGPHGRELVRPQDPDNAGARRAETYYAVVEQAAPRVAWLAMMPVTGRTHQLRAHCQAIGHPILGDPKYGGYDALKALGRDVGKGLHLHARSIDIGHPAGGRLHIEAPLPDHMATTFRFLGFETDDDGDPFAELEL